MDLGQVFTKETVAEYMVSLFTLNENAIVLDPCFGGGAFLNALQKNTKYRVAGYEIDENLYKGKKDKYPLYELWNSDFLQAPKGKKYDGVIMNPPYIRHEKINSLTELGVSKQKLGKCDIYSKLPTTANLYMYFIIKAISLLKKNGELIVIFPGSWLQAKNGNQFETTLYENCSIEKQVFISGDVFEESAMVDVIILKLRKDGKNRQALPEYIRLGENGLEEYENHSKAIRIDFETPFSSISSVRRGLTTGYNDMFINPVITDSDRYIKPIISSPKQITGYSTNGALSDQLLVVDDDSTGITSFLSSWEKKILKDGKPETLVKKIKEKKKWYKLNLFDCHGIIFSYFVRNDMKFVYNDSDNIIRDNFYIIYPKIDKWICFALLNNLFTYYQLECVGKKYGAGLLKIQRYDIENLLFPDISLISSEDLSELRKMGEMLAKTGKKSLVNDITRVLSQYSKVTYAKISEEYKDIVNSRLENV